MGRLAIVMLAVVSACTRDVVAPAHDAPPARASVESADEGPPPPHGFGPDTYRVGAFTGLPDRLPSRYGLDAPSAPSKEDSAAPASLESGGTPAAVPVGEMAERTHS